MLVVWKKCYRTQQNSHISSAFLWRRFVSVSCHRDSSDGSGSLTDIAECLSCDIRKLQMTDAVKLYYISKINGKIEVKIGMQAQKKVWILKCLFFLICLIYDNFSHSHMYILTISSPSTQFQTCLCGCWATTSVLRTPGFEPETCCTPAGRRPEELTVARS